MRQMATIRACLITMVLLAAGGQPLPAADLVLVAGATGGTGQQVVRELATAGYRVRALVRDAASARTVLGESVEYAIGDVRERPTIDAALRDVRYAISTVGDSRNEPGNRPDSDGPDSNGPEAVDFEGVRNLAQAAAAAKVEQLVVVSSAGVTRPDHPLNRMFDDVLLWKAKGENAVRESGVSYTIVRPGGLTDQPGGKAAVRLEQGDNGTGFIPRADVARVCVAALKSAGALNRTFEIYGASGSPDADWDAMFGQLAADERPRS